MWFQTFISKLTLGDWIAIAAIIIGLFGAWYFNKKPIQPNEPLVRQEANQNSSSTITQIANVNQVAEFTL
ncbi:MAG: hypothetical protein Q7R79_04470, partial [bacterium]|nr:hypothetical protein [bacterium]